jgi:aryl-alcohol dehydrogenase-like predicted oxidoreductase
MFADQTSLDERLRECEASLERLGTDHVDLYYLHRDYSSARSPSPWRVRCRRIAPRRASR